MTACWFIIGFRAVYRLLNPKLRFPIGLNALVGNRFTKKLNEFVSAEPTEYGHLRLVKDAECDHVEERAILFCFSASLGIDDLLAT